MPDEGEQGGGIGETFTVLAKTYAYAPTLPLPLFFSFFLSFFLSTQFKVVGYFFPFLLRARSAVKNFLLPAGGKRERERVDRREVVARFKERNTRGGTRASEEEREEEEEEEEGGGKILPPGLAKGLKHRGR